MHYLSAKKGARETRLFLYSNAKRSKAFAIQLIIFFIVLSVEFNHYRKRKACLVYYI